jgi:hypothetical protein
MKIFLDDDPVRDSWVDDTWTIVRTPEDALTLIMRHYGEVEVVSLDHDLGYFIADVELTGYDVVKTIERLVFLGELRPQGLPRFEIHSANSVGRKNMQAAIDSIERMRKNV